jgi:hypothetical protein
VEATMVKLNSHVFANILLALDHGNLRVVHSQTKEVFEKDPWDDGKREAYRLVCAEMGDRMEERQTAHKSLLAHLFG